MCSSECVVIIVSSAALLALLAFAIGTTYVVATRNAKRALAKSRAAYDPLLDPAQAGGDDSPRDDLEGAGDDRAYGLPVPPLGLSNPPALYPSITRGLGLPEVTVTVKSDKNLQTLKVDEKLLGLKPRPYNKAWDSGVFINPVAGKLAAKAHCPPGLLLSINGIPITHHSQIRKLILPSTDGAGASEDLELVVRPTAVIADGLITYVVQLHNPHESPGVDLKYVDDPDAPSRIVVSKVHPDTPCDFFGVKPGSYVTALDGTPARTREDVARLLAASRETKAPALRITVVEPDANCDEAFMNKHEEEEEITLKPTMVRVDVGPEASAAGAGFICEERQVQHPEYDMMVAQAVWPSEGTPLQLAGVPKGAFIHRIGGALITELEHIAAAVRRAAEGTGHIVVEFFAPDAFTTGLQSAQHASPNPSTRRPPEIPYDKYDVFTEFAHLDKLCHGFSPDYLKGLPHGGPLPQPPGVQQPVPPEARVSSVYKLPLKKEVPKAHMHQNPATYKPGMTPIKEPIVIETLTIDAPSEVVCPPAAAFSKLPAHSCTCADDPSDDGVSLFAASEALPGPASEARGVKFAADAPAMPAPMVAGAMLPTAPGETSRSTLFTDGKGEQKGPKRSAEPPGVWVPKTGMFVRTRAKGVSVAYREPQKQRAGMKAMIAGVHTHTKEGGDVIYVTLVFPKKEGALTWRWEDCTCVTHALEEASVIVPVTCSKCDKTIWTIGPNQSYSCIVCNNRYHKSCGKALVEKGVAKHAPDLRSTDAPDEGQVPVAEKDGEDGDSEERAAKLLVMNWDNADKIEAVSKVGGRLAWKEMTWTERLEVVQKVRAGEAIQARRLKTLEVENMIRTSL
eukprot:TRINITY_DN5267_c0_g2_i1.p1 TRINITY_DN5267_c0_g2~~TRINITY_DN5267_c0_g2_i1.p1  ORF type:complete len:849 (+),score=266.41 TRINITY_DN5267_c0_g2_i1:126-2672(+)